MQRFVARLISVAAARRLLGGLLLLFGVTFIAFSSSMLLEEAKRLQFQHASIRALMMFAIAIVPIVVGIAVITRRMRGTATLLCVIGLLLHVPLGFVRPLGGEFMAVALVYWFTFILLLWPDRSNPFAGLRRAKPGSNGNAPGNASWRTRLLASLTDAAVERMPDRFLESVLSYMAIVGVLALSQFILNHLPQPNDLVWWVVVRVVWFALWLVLLLPVYRRLARLNRQAQTRNAEDEILRPGSRPPILYLRSFELDARLSDHRLTLRDLLFLQAAPTAEEILAKELRRCGPVIALGRPGERLPELGAARFYVVDERWRDKVAEVARVSQLVVAATGTTQSLAWELSYLIANLPPERLVLWAHPHLLRLKAADREAEWRRFLAALGSLFPKPLPERLGAARFIHFDSAFNPVLVVPEGRWWQLRRACRAVLAAKDLPKPDPVLIGRRRVLLGVTGVSAAILLIAAGGLFGVAHGIDARVRRRVRVLLSLIETLTANERAPTPAEVLEQHEAFLTWAPQDWRAELGATREQHNRLRPLLAAYVAVFRRAHASPPIEALLHANDRPLFVDLTDSSDASARRAAVTAVSSGLASVQRRYRTIYQWLPATLPALSYDEGGTIRDFERRIEMRLALLQAEAAILRWLIDHPQAWTMVPTDDGTARVPQVSNRRLRNQFAELVKQRHEAFDDLHAALAPRSM
jgi:hypothetical protein